VEAQLEQDLTELLAIAAGIIEAGRKPTDEERERFLALRVRVDAAPATWRDRVADGIDRLAAAFEGMGF
jgi:hypothetical protein